jgi:phospholipase/carboxylesterase
VINFSGFLVEDPAVSVTPATVGRTHFFWGHGLQDPAIPHQLARKGRSRLEEAGALLTVQDYPIGHWISPEEAEDVRRWLEAPGEPLERSAEEG